MVNRQRFIRAKTRSAQQGWLKELEPDMQRGMDDLLQSALMRSEFTLPCGWMVDTSVALTDDTELTIDWTSVTAAIDSDSYKSNAGWTVPAGLGGKHVVIGIAVIDVGAASHDQFELTARVTNGGTTFGRSHTNAYIANASVTDHLETLIAFGMTSASDGDVIDFRVESINDNADNSVTDVYFGFVRVAD